VRCCVVFRNSHCTSSGSIFQSTDQSFWDWEGSDFYDWLENLPENLPGTKVREELL